MNISYNWLRTYFNKPLPKPKNLAEILTMHCFENETLTKKGNDFILGIDVLPDRAGDCLCHLGIAKECAAVLDKKIIFSKITMKENKKNKAKDYLKVEIKDKNTCLRYTARILDNVQIKPSPKYIQERLIACGLTPINNVVDIANYVMLEFGQPLHAFDYQNIEGKKIIVRYANQNEKITTLSNLTYSLNDKILIIADAKKPLAIAGIKGGKDAEINNTTKTVVLESANFNAKLISQTARKINLRTDASIRFEQNLDPNLTEIAINRAAQLIQADCKAKIAEGIIDIYPNKVFPKKITLLFSELTKILGIEIKSTEVVSILKRLSIKIIKKNEGAITVEVPTYRQDILLPENLIEEIGRVYGYEKIKPELPCGHLSPVSKNKNIYWQNKTKDILKELGYTEVYNYSFIGDKEKNIFGLNPIEITNPVSNEFKYLRPELIPQLINNAKENLKTYSNFKIFELNKVFIQDLKEKKELTKLAGVVADTQKSSQKIFTTLRGELNHLFNELGIYKIDFEKENQANENALAIFVKGKKIGSFGQVSDYILDQINIKEKLFGFNINFEKVQQFCTKEKIFIPISFHPPARRDISGLISKDTQLEKIVQAILSVDKQFIKSAEIYDVYQGKNVPENQKSVSIHIVYQSNEKTLDSKSIDRLQNEVLSKLIKSFNWQPR
ncbi:MAG TPA: phenylalanine--tRNA ligase subunit beta [Candidatus Pacearchaeota archaeon]|nr:phenylalanine--tRNA ligase subunit beta [Candidatus Pacearchaeota archaeon]